MFKVGDKVVCIEPLDKPNENILKKNKIYTINIILQKRSMLALDNVKGGFVIDRFITLSEFRKQKIKKICSRLETK